jgi:CRP-like cAMP-binding protein
MGATQSDKMIQAIRQAFGCGEALGATIAGLAREAPHARGAMLWNGYQDDASALLCEGRAQELAFGREGAVLVLHALHAGELFGAIMGAGEGAGRIEALEHGSSARFTTATVLRLMEGYPLVALAVARQMSARIEAMRRRMVETALLSATGRICSELLRLARASSDLAIRPLPVFSELAVTVQSTRETVSRTISQLEKRGVLQRIEGGLAVIAPHRLEEMIY